MSASSKAACVVAGVLSAWVVIGGMRFLYQRTVVIRLAEAFARQEAKDARGS